ncbi:MAG: glycosyltransferase family 4 protein [Crocinitomicaceae bacterium]
MKKLKVWVIKLGEPPPLKENIRLWRAGLLAKELAKQGHEVTLWNSTFLHFQKEFAFDKSTELMVSDNLKLVLIKSLGYHKNISFKRYIDHRFVANQFNRIAKKHDIPDIIVVAIPCHHLAYKISKYALRNRVPYICDLRDLWPDIFLNIFPRFVNKKLAQAILRKEFYRFKFTSRNANSLVAVSQSYLELLASRANRKPGDMDKVFHVGSHPIPIDLDEQILDDQPVKEILYVGSFGNTYDLESMIKTARHFYENGITDVKFVLAGGGEQAENLQTLAKELPNVMFTGWLDTNGIHKYLKRAYIGVLPFKRNAPQSLPNKLFDYLSAGLPVVSSLQNADMINIIEQKQIGLSFDPESWESLCEKCLWFIQHPEERLAMSVRSKEFYMNHGNSNLIYKDYVAHIENVYFRERQNL